MTREKAFEVYRNFLMGWLMEFGDQPITTERWHKSVWWNQIVVDPEFRGAMDKFINPSRLHVRCMSGGSPATVTEAGKRFIQTGKLE